MIPFSVKKLFKCALVVVIVFVFFYRVCVVNQQKVSNSEIVKILTIAKFENVRRSLHVYKICQKYNLGNYKTDLKPVIYKEPPTPHYEIFFYDLPHKLSWCPIYKAGSTTWLYNFALLGGSTDEKITSSKLQINEFVRNIFPALSSEQAIAFLPRSLKFFIVRHPFERVLSAYRDKLENIATHTKSGTPHYYQKYGRKIVAKYRIGGNNTNSREILKQGQYIWNYDKEPLGIEPTFKEFVRYLIDTDLITRSDDHWMPFYLYCTPCTLKFNIIGKVETMEQDQLLIIHTGNLQHKLRPHWRHRTNPFNQTGSSGGISDIAKMYFLQLNEHDVRELYEKYKLDFILFEYSETDYLKHVIRESDSFM